MSLSYLSIKLRNGEAIELEVVVLVVVATLVIEGIGGLGEVPSLLVRVHHAGLGERLERFVHGIQGTVGGEAGLAAVLL